MSKVTVLNRDLDLSLANRLDPVVYLPKVTVANTAIVNRARCSFPAATAPRRTSSSSAREERSATS
jgi:hypothetical protein